MRKRATWGFLAALILVVALAGCATVNVKPMPTDNTAKLSTTGKAAMILAAYNAQALSTKNMSNRPNLTDAQKDLVRRKKAILVKMDPKVKAFGLIVKGGGVPSASDEQELYSFIDELAALGE
jgi:hypothetical protein